MKKSFILSGTALIGFLMINLHSYASPTFYAGSLPEGPAEKAPWTAQDFGRTIVGFIESIINLCGEGEAKAKLLTKQEENNQNTSGSGGNTNNTDTSQGKLADNMGSAGESEFTGSAFDYVNTYVLSKEGNVGYEALKTALASAQDENTVRANIRTAVIEEFFADPEKAEQRTTEYQNGVNEKRNRYILDATQRHVTLGYRVKGHIQNDLGVIASAAVSGDGEIGSIAVDAHTLEQMVKMELVDLALQIEMMEADAIQFLIQQPVELMSKTKPTS